jgi:hypothetical protein
MAVELVAHTSLSQHSPPFSLAGATAYSVDVTGTLADGGIELQMLVNGSYVPLSPPISFFKTVRPSSGLRPLQMDSQKRREQRHDRKL